jgi:hypothetical protein
MFNTFLLIVCLLRSLHREIAGSLSGEKRADRSLRVFMGRDARLLRRRREAKSGNARWRKRLHLRQAHGRTSVSIRTNPRSGLWRRESCDKAVATRQEIDHRRR